MPSTHAKKPSQAQAAYDARLLEVYVILSLEKKSPDVPIAELYAQVGGSFPKFAKTLEACYRGHHAVPTLGEPVFASTCW
jgi:hypothetical protein